MWLWRSGVCVQQNLFKKATLARVWIGLGGNLGEARAAIAQALQYLDQHPQVRVLARSGDYRTPPWGKTDQPTFINAAAALETDLSARALLDICLEIEHALGRVRGEKWGPRQIDIDLIDYDGRVIDGPGLALPHPHALERAFVLAPLLEIAPDGQIGGFSIRAALTRLDARGIERLPDGE
jgi:2-amino-4-hydroxy-6-hydroxymethyldihydropteridine diphosphokinase